MKKLTTEEKEQIRTMLEQQDAEQHKKRRRYRNYKANIHSSRYPGDAEERLGKLEKKHEKTQHAVAKHSQLKTVHLTEREKKELAAKIREAM